VELAGAGRGGLLNERRDRTGPYELLFWTHAGPGTRTSEDYSCVPGAALSANVDEFERNGTVVPIRICERLLHVPGEAVGGRCDGAVVGVVIRGSRWSWARKAGGKGWR
jgi:hypothetical protein